MATTQTQCIHGFPSEHCVSCRTCEHGHPAGSCARCRTATPARKGVEPVGDQTSHDHAGYEIFYEPAVSGWRYRAADAAPSPLSYRSAFLARKAVDEQKRLHAGAPASAKGKGRKT